MTHGQGFSVLPSALVGSVLSADVAHFTGFAAVIDPSAPPLPTAITAMAAGSMHTCYVVPPAGTVKCWGANDRGQLGIGGSAYAGAPTDVVNLAGVVALAASAAARLAGSEALWVVLWVAAAVLCAIISSWATMRKAKRSGEPMISGPARKLALSFSPPMIVGALLTLVLVRMSLTELLPGVWLSIYGTAVVAGGAYSVRIVPVMGFCFMALGAVALFTPAGLGDWLMALGFASYFTFAA
jgi:hypothetical protein